MSLFALKLACMGDEATYLRRYPGPVEVELLDKLAVRDSLRPL